MLPQTTMRGRSHAGYLGNILNSMASPARFELTTPGLGILCSIRLSYGDFTNYINGLAVSTSSAFRRIARSIAGASSLARHDEATKAPRT